MVSAHSVVDSESTVRSEKGKTHGGATELHKGLVGKFPTTLYGKNALVLYNGFTGYHPLSNRFCHARSPAFRLALHAPFFASLTCSVQLTKV